jgi:hypothetical protein
MRFLPVLFAGLIAASSGPLDRAWSQTPGSEGAVGEDWQLVEAPERKLTMAVADFSNGVTVASRCMDGDFEVTVNGLPEIRSASRVLRVSVGEEPLSDETWTVAETRTAAFSRVPAPLARRLAKGGRLNIVVPGERGAPNRRYVMELSPSPAALERTLTACGRALIDPRDAIIDRNAPDGLTRGVEWVRMPRPEFPNSVRGRIALRGSVTLSCLTDDQGKAVDCVIESEHPGGFNFGKAVIRSMERARLRAAGDDPTAVTGRRFLFTTNFMMQD